MAVGIITGYTGTQHVTSAKARACNASRVAAGKYVYDIGLKFAHEIISNNLIRVKNGYAINQGCEFGIGVNDYEEVTLDNGLAGVNRIDLIVARYHKDTTSGIESITMAVVKGTSATTPVAPTYTTGDIFAGETDDDYPLYSVYLTGLTVTSVTPLFSLTPSSKKVADNIALPYSPSSTYAVGSYCFYDTALYKCIAAITVAESWNAAKWTSVTVGSELLALNTNLAKKNYTLSIATNFTQITDDKAWLYAENGQVHLHCNLYISTGYAANTYLYPAVLPVGCLPDKVIMCQALMSVAGGAAGSESPGAGLVYIGTNGQIIAITSTTGKNCCSIDIVFPVT